MQLLETLIRHLSGKKIDGRLDFFIDHSHYQVVSVGREGVRIKYANDSTSASLLKQDEYTNLLISRVEIGPGFRLGVRNDIVIHCRWAR